MLNVRHTVYTLALAAIAASTGTNAAVLNCPAAIAASVSGTAACQYSTTANQDFLNTTPITVNAEAFFAFTDWVFGGKIGVDAGYAGSGEGQSGTWDISGSAIAGLDDIMLVFKSGAGTTLVGYLLADGVTSGTWTTPFLPSLFDVTNPRDVSHISVYGRGSTVSVPEPATLLLTGTGLFGLALARRRRKSH